MDYILDLIIVVVLLRKDLLPLIPKSLESLAGLVQIFDDLCFLSWSRSQFMFQWYTVFYLMKHK